MKEKLTDDDEDEDDEDDDDDIIPPHRISSACQRQSGANDENTIPHQVRIRLLTLER